MHLTDRPGHPVIILFIIAAASVLSSCELLRYYETKWDLEGEAYITGVNNISNDIKLAAFYIDEPGGNLTPARNMVSNVINLGTTVNNHVSFTLSIDMSSFNLEDGDEIGIYMWEDANDDSLFDTGEDKSVCAPGPGCMVFNQTALAVFFFVKDNKDMSDGWYLNTPSGILAVEDAGLTGAELINNSAL
jgi:hypothetical protein